MGEAKVILGVKIIRNDDGIMLSQEHYVEKLLKKFGHFDVKLNFSRPDIAYVVCRLSRYTHNPNRDHWTAIVRQMRYLKGTMNYGIMYSGYLAILEGYSDANWISDSDEIKSTSGYIFTLGGGTVAWKSAKQTIIAKSTMESECVALELAGNEVEWLRNFLADIPLCSKPTPSIVMHCDCQQRITISKNKTFNARTKHIDIRHHFIRDLVEKDLIHIDHVSTENRIIDILTKSLDFERFSS
ncbi:hypothetical protein DH2020_037497 [Rehmannia glutinosa]|uniref:Retrovirus-related Pol polyprotein from transposon TNT 1-94 n=1 Tax=Rehmannia glutinosa TaxID=99300 RepID=A0ABR0V3Q5_REHGL